MKGRFCRMVGILGLGAAFVAAACSDSATVPADAPEGHTVMKEGVAHAPGLNNPVAACGQCHGADLRGGNAGQPSCYSCHGQKW